MLHLTAHSVAQCWLIHAQSVWKYFFYFRHFALSFRVFFVYFNWILIELKYTAKNTEKRSRVAAAHACLPTYIHIHIPAPVPAPSSYLYPRVSLFKYQWTLPQPMPLNFSHTHTHRPPTSLYHLLFPSCDCNDTKLKQHHDSLGRSRRRSRRRSQKLQRNNRRRIWLSLCGCP